MLQTPVSPEPTHSTPLASSSAFAAATSGDADGEPADVRLEFDPFPLGLPERDRHLPGPKLLGVVRVLREAEHFVVPGERPLRVPGGDVDEVDPLNLASRLAPVTVGRVAVVEHQPVPVGILEERHVAHPGVVWLRELELDTAGREPLIACDTSATRNATPYSGW